MGLLDNLARAILNNTNDEQLKIAQIAMDLFNQNGGVAGILEKFNAHGMTEQANSWVSNGGNMPISAEQVISVLGSNTIAEFAAKFGTNPESLGTTIAEKLPILIDKMTPNGQVPEGSGNLLAALLSMAK